MQCLDRITASMCLLAERRWPSSHRVDEAGILRVVARPTTPDEMVRAAYGHIHDAAKGSPAVMARLRECLELLIARTEDPALSAALKRERAKA